VFKSFANFVTQIQARLSDGKRVKKLCSVGHFDDASGQMSSLVVSVVTLYGYFSAPTQALGDGSGNYITSASVRGRMTTGTPVTYLPFTQTNVVGPAAGSLLLYAQAVTLLNPVGSRDDNLDLRIDLTALTIPAGTYTGVLTIQARSI